MTQAQLRIISDRLLLAATALSESRNIGSGDAEFHSKGVGVTILLALSSAFNAAYSEGGNSNADRTA